MRVDRSFKEVLGKASFKSVAEVMRLARDVKEPLKQLQIFLGIKELTPNWIVSLRSGHRIPIQSIHDFQQTFWDCLVRKSYTVLPTDKIIIDVGANIGCFTIYALSKNPDAKIFAFEPSSSNYTRLQSLVALNKLEKQVKTFQKGVARKSGELSLNISVDSAFHTSFGHAAVGEENETIQVMSLKDLLAAVNISEEIDLLKMDCEGAEMDCLFGADSDSLSKIKRIEIEYHEWAGFSFDELKTFLGKNEFNLQTLNHNQKDRNGNASFVRTKV